MIPRSLLLGLALALSLFVGCSKHKSEQPSTPTTTDLGTVELTYGTPSRHDLGNGFACVLTAQPMNAASFELFAALEKDGKQVATSRVAPAAINQPMSIAFGTVNVTLTPQPK